MALQGDDENPPRRFRDRHRAARHRAFLETARRIVTTEGHAALTMQRITDALGTSVGGIYVYFPTKDALIAELQREALNALHTSYLLGQTRLDAVLADRGAEPATAALARVVATGRFWIESEATLPTDIELSRRIFGDARAVAAGDEASRVLPAALQLLDEARQRFDAASKLGALDPADNLERAVVTISALNGVLLSSKVGSWDQALFDGARLASSFLPDLLVGWGATRQRLAAADAHLDAFAEHDSFAPVPGPADHDPQH